MLADNRAATNQSPLLVGHDVVSSTRTLGTLPSGLALREVVDRATPTGG